MFAVMFTVTFLDRLERKPCENRAEHTSISVTALDITRYPELIIFDKKRGSCVHGGARDATAFPGNMKDREVNGTRSQHGLSKGKPACKT